MPGSDTAVFEAHGLGFRHVRLDIDRSCHSWIATPLQERRLPSPDQ